MKITPVLLPELTKLTCVSGINIEVTDQQLFATEALVTELWPQAANPRFIVVDAASQQRRAATIVKSFVGAARINGKKFLDFGCGTGYVAKAATQQGAVLSVGYDLMAYDDWAKLDCQLTTDWNVVREHAPYDTVLLYDVLDHVPVTSDREIDDLDEDIVASGGRPIVASMIDVLSQIREVAPQADFVVRCHPWLAKHGTHLYTSFNKAHAHIFFSDEYLSSLGATIVHTNKVKLPRRTYKRVFMNSGLEIVSQDEINSPVDQFFCTDYFTNKLLEHYIDTGIVGGSAKELLSFEFLDYVTR